MQRPTLRSWSARNTASTITVIGEALVRTWGLSEEVALAVRYHHDLLKLDALNLPLESRMLIALSTAATEALARSAGRRREEWAVEVDAAATTLGWTPADLEERIGGPKV